MYRRCRFAAVMAIGLPLLYMLLAMVGSLPQPADKEPPPGGAPLSALPAGGVSLPIGAPVLDAGALGSLDGVDEAAPLVGSIVMAGMVMLGIAVIAGAPVLAALLAAGPVADGAGLLGAAPVLEFGAAVVRAGMDVDAVSSASLSAKSRVVSAEQADPTKPAVARQASVR